MRTRHITLILILFVSVLLMFSSPIQGEDGASDTREESIGSIQTDVFLKEGYELSPRSPLQTDLDLEQALPREVDSTGDGIDWKSVGVWKSNELRTDLTIEGSVIYSLWFYNRGFEGKVDLRVSLLSNDVEIDDTIIEVFDQTIEEDPKEMKLVTSVTNPIKLKPGDVLSIKIETRNNGSNAYLYYGGPDYRSKVVLTCDSLRIPGMTYDKEEKSIVVQVTDAFGMSPALLNPTLNIDGMDMGSNYNLGIDSETFNWQLIYFLDLYEHLKEGEHTSLFSLSYSKDGEVVSSSITFIYGHPRSPSRKDSDSYSTAIWISFFTSAIVLAIILKRNRRT